MKVYLAAPYQMKETIKERAEQVRALGIEVTSRWLEEPHKPATQLNELTHEEHRAYATQDIEDVIAADVMVFFTDQTKAIVRAGRHVEFGVAVAINKLIRPMSILVVGSNHENIFHHLEGVRHFQSWTDAKNELFIMQSGR